MALPVDYQTCRVTAHYVDLLGVPATGTVTFTAQAIRIVSPATETIVLPTPVTVQVDPGGEFDINLPATDDPDITPIGFTYQVIEKLNAGSLSYNIEAPVGGHIDLSTVITSNPGTGVTVTQGPTGPVGPALVAKGTVASAVTLPSSGVDGDMYQTLDTGHAWSWNGAVWVDLGPFRGEKGAPTERGLLAARPDASALGKGALYSATDDNNGTLLVVDKVGSTYSWVKAAPSVGDISPGPWFATPTTVAPITGMPALKRVPELTTAPFTYPGKPIVATLTSMAMIIGGTNPVRTDISLRYTKDGGTTWVTVLQDTARSQGGAPFDIETSVPIVAVIPRADDTITAGATIQVALFVKRNDANNVIIFMDLPNGVAPGLSVR